MTQPLLAEIKQRKPFPTIEEEAYLNLLRTASALQQSVVEALRPADLTPTQYNALRILRGAGDEGVTCGEIGDRMVARDPDITRLLDRLERRRLIDRWRDTADRRVVKTRITPSGRELLADLDEPMNDLHLRQLSHLGAERLKQLVHLLEDARNGDG